MAEENIETDLFNAFRYGNLQELTRLIDSRKQGASSGLSGGYSLLRWAVMMKQIGVVKLLLDRGCPVNASGADHDSPLHLAAENLDSGMAQLLLQKGADVNSKNKNGETPLLIAVERADADIVELLLKYGANAVNADLFKAIRDGNLQEVTALIDSNEQGTSSGLSEGYSLLVMAVKRNEVDIVKLLLDRGCPVNTSEPVPESPLHHAVETSDRKVVELLLQKGADVNSKNKNGETPFLIAVERADSDIVDLFLKYGTGVNVDLFNAVREGNLQKTTKLIDSLEQSASSGQSGHSLLVMAVEKNHVDIVKLLLDRGCPVNAAEAITLSPLHHAAYNGNLEMVQLLLDNGADVNNRDGFDETPLFVACEVGHFGIVPLLLKSGADVNAKSSLGETALHRALYFSYQEVAVFLLENGAQVNCEGESGETPLHMARDPIIIEILMGLGAKIDCRNKEGRTPLLLAAESGRLQAVASLLEHGADANIKCVKNRTPLDYAIHEYDAFHGSGGTIAMENDHYSPKVTCDILLQHQAKMEAVGLHVEKSLLSVKFEETLKQFRENYQEEASLLNCEFIKGTSVSFYDIVRKDVRFLAKYMDNENVVQAAELGEFWRKFPMYASVINRQFRRGRARNKLLKAANQVLQQLIDLPHYCSDKIMDYLCDDDMTVLFDV